METSVTSLSGVCITGFHSLELGFQQTCLLHKKKAKESGFVLVLHPSFSRLPALKLLAKSQQQGGDSMVKISPPDMTQESSTRESPSEHSLLSAPG